MEKNFENKLNSEIPYRSEAEMRKFLMELHMGAFRQMQAVPKSVINPNDPFPYELQCGNALSSLHDITQYLVCLGTMEVIKGFLEVLNSMQGRNESVEKEVQRYTKFLSDLAENCVILSNKIGLK